VTEHVGPGGSGLLAVGTELHGRYRIVRVIGRGGMSAVYEAEHSGLGKRVAIKEMLLPVREGPEAEEAIRLFQNEARTLARLEHQYLPDVTDFFSQDDRYYLVMAYVTGETLDDLVRRTPGFITEDLALRWASQLCDVLSYLHSQTPLVVFRDLKPSNIMVDENGQVKLIDFGIARIFKPGKQSDTQSMGTAGYSAPEQYGTGQTDARSDIYSLGACLHFLLTRRDPTSAPFNFPPIRELNPRVSANTERVVARCLSMKPEDRYTSAADVKAALAPRVQEPDTTFLARPAVPSPRAVAPPPPITLPPPPDRQPAWVIPLILLVIAAAGGALFYFIKYGPEAFNSQPTNPVVLAPVTVTVPDLAGKTESQARQALALAQLTMMRHSEPSDLPTGQVDRQDPAAGVSAPTGSVVNVFFSAGPNTVQVPDVGHMSVDQAKKLLGLKGLKVGETTAQSSDTIPDGYVIGTEPKAGLRIAPGQPVDLVLSNGPPPPPTPPAGPTTTEPQFKVTVPVPQDNAAHDVKVVVRQTDGSSLTVFDHSVQQDDVETVQAPSADAISATVDGADVQPDVQPLTTPDNGAAPPPPPSGDQSNSP